MTTSADLTDILLRATSEDLPSGITLHDTSTTDTRRVKIQAGECVLATIHQHWRADAPKHYVGIEFEPREAEIDALLQRIANATRARLRQNKSEADAILNQLNLR